MTVFLGKSKMIGITLQAFGLSCPILHISWRMCGFSGDWFPVFPSGYSGYIVLHGYNGYSDYGDFTVPNIYNNVVLVGM